MYSEHTKARHLRNPRPFEVKDASGGGSAGAAGAEKKEPAGAEAAALKEAPTREMLLKMIHDLHETIQKSSKERDETNTRIDDIIKVQNELRVSGKMTGPTFQTKDADLDSFNYRMKSVNYDVKSLDDLILLETKDPIIRYLQEQSDLLYIAQAICKRVEPGYDIKGWRMYKGFATELGMFSKALATSLTTGGAEWIPTNFSSTLVELVRLELKVAALHQRITMPTPTFTLPVEGSDMFGYLVSEAIGDSSTSIPTSNPKTKNVSFVAKKIATRVLTSAELDEDSIVSILPYLRSRIVRALAFAEEYAIINGDTAGTRDNTDQAGAVIGATSNIKAWNGYRKIGADIGKGVVIDAAGAFATDGSHLLRVRASMGKYGVNPSDLVWVTGPRGYNKMLGIKRIQTLQDFGANAILQQGQLGALFGMPIVVSEWVREDLNGSGVSGGASASGFTDTIILGVNKMAFAIGDRRKMTLKTEEVIDTDQIKLVATERLDFKGLYATSERTVGGVYDLE